MEKIKIRCPFCSKVLIVSDNPDNFGKKLKCPVCKQVDLFDNFSRVEEKPESDETRVGNLFKKSTAVFGIKYKEYYYPLSEGNNLVGRKAQSSSANVKIDNTEDAGFSRSHLNIEIIKGCDGAWHSYLSNASNKNITYLNGIPVGAGEKLGLRNGDRIRSSSTELIFNTEMVYDDDETRLS